MSAELQASIDGEFLVIRVPIKIEGPKFGADAPTFVARTAAGPVTTEARIGERRVKISFLAWLEPAAHVRGRHNLGDS